MRNIVRATAVVQRGGKIELDVPELAEGVQVEVTVVPSQQNSGTNGASGIADFLHSLPPSNLSEAQWARRDAEFAKDRNEWDR
jgi:hypothetical protein